METLAHLSAHPGLDPQRRGPKSTLMIAGPLRLLRHWTLEEDPVAAARMLAVFRLMLGGVLLWQALATARDLPLLVGEFGLIQRNLNDALALEVNPRIAWVAPAWLS